MSQSKSDFCACGHTGYVHSDNHYNCACCDCEKYRHPGAKGFKARSFKGIPIAVEKHKDGSVTIAEEIVQDILKDADVPEWVKALFKV